jgi:hypothetical protein
MVNDMADDKKTKKADVQQNLPANGPVVDLSAFMPQGYSADDLRIIGGLTPIYAPEAVAEGRFPPCAGFLDRIEVLPDVVQKARIYVPVMIRVVASHPTKGILGKKETLEIVDVAEGEEILVPITGNLRTNKVLLGSVPGGRSIEGLTEAQIKAITLPPKQQGCGLVAIPPMDVNKVFFAVFQVLGQKDVGQPSEMWEWEVALHPITQDRRTFMKGRFALPEGPITKGELPQTASGHPYNPQTGEVYERTPASAAS